MGKFSDTDSIIQNLDFSPLSKLVESVLNDTSGYSVYLGGGYIRDLYFNAINNCDDMTPKDIDLFFIPNGEQKRLPTIVKSYVNYDTPSSDIPDMEERGVQSVRGLFVPWASTKDVQFIVYKECMTQEQLASDMDCNVNQIMLCLKTGNAFATNEFIQGHEDKEIEILHTFNYLRMGKRLARMSDKFPSYTVIGDWNLTEFAQKVRDNVGSFCDNEE